MIFAVTISFVSHCEVVLVDIREAEKILVRINDSTSVRYAHIRAEWSLMNSEQRREADDSRTRAHNALIDSCNILSRNMNKSGDSVAWRALPGDDRKVIGDFACYLHCLLSIKSSLDDRGKIFMNDPSFLERANR